MELALSIDPKELGMFYKTVFQIYPRIGAHGFKLGWRRYS